MDIEKKEYNTQSLSFSNTLPPPPPYTTSSTTNGPQTLSVNYLHWNSSILITDQTGQQLYSTHRSRCSSNMEVTNQTGQPIGTSKTSKLTSQIDINMQNTATGESSFEMHNSAGILGGSPKFTSPAFGGQEMVWKNTAMSRKIIYTLIDGNGNAIAKFESDPKSCIGTLEVTGEMGGQERLDEAVVTLMALLVRKLKNIQASYIAAVT